MNGNRRKKKKTRTEKKLLRRRIIQKKKKYLVKKKKKKRRRKKRNEMALSLETNIYGSLLCFCLLLLEKFFVLCLKPQTDVAFVL